MKVPYYSKNGKIIVVDNEESESVVVVNVETQELSIYPYALYGLVNEDIIRMIIDVTERKEIKFEIEEYKKSEMYKLLEEIGEEKNVAIEF